MLERKDYEDKSKNYQQHFIGKNTYLTTIGTRKQNTYIPILCTHSWIKIRIRIKDITIEIYKEQRYKRKKKKNSQKILFLFFALEHGLT